VLLIEDDDDDAMIVKDLLDDVGGPVELARGRTLSEGIGRLPGQIACVLVDLRLPDADGLDAVRRLRDAAPETAVIVLTGMAEEAAGEAAVEAGAQDYLVKGRVDGPSLGCGSRKPARTRPRDWSAGSCPIRCSPARRCGSPPPTCPADAER
jgi:CheY-like chemotaxis protein